MKVFLVTHGLRSFGPDPVHTPEGIAQIKALIPVVCNIGVSAVFIGTGKRFQEIFDTLAGEARWALTVPVWCSPLCGNADGVEPDGRIILTNGKLVDMDEYMGIMNNPAVNAWQFIAFLPDKAILLAGGELMLALGFKAENEKGHLFEIDLETKSCRKIA
jgi:hypothetical protein